MRGKNTRAEPRSFREAISGQVSIVAAALMGTTFFLFFAFVVNTGMLVHAKINLQNAADVAAYAGAATQARHLENIGILNYELRRQYKRFLYRYYVLGNLTRPDKSSAGAYQFGAFESPSNNFKNLGVPAVCMVFKANDNYCSRYNLTPIQVGSSPLFGDAIGSALKEVLDNIENIRQQNCTGLSIANSYALYLWLYSAHPDAAINLIRSVATDDQTLLALKTIPAVTKGLGIIPRNLITYQRINTLKQILNRTAETGLTSERARSLEQGPTPMLHERSVLAFKSVERTLGSSLFGEGKFQMDELLPPGPEPVLQLQPHFAEFNTYATFVGTDAGTGACEQRLLSMPVKGQALPVAVSKTGPLTYYAVRVRGTPNLLFNPFNLTLEAYAAARPFGARLGPQPGPDLGLEFKRPGSNPIGVTVKGPSGGGVPNIALIPKDTLGFYNPKIFRGLRDFVSASSSGVIDPNRLVQAEGIAALPNLGEYGRYIVPTDFDSPGDRLPNALDYKDYFVNGGFYSFYAPVSLDGGLSAKAQVETLLTQFPDPDGMSGLKQKLAKDLAEYFGKLANNQGEGGEGVQIARVLDPMKDVTGNDVSGLGGAIMPKITGADLRPWFSGSAVAPLRAQSGRVAYSVKLVSFKSLQSSGVSVSASESDPTPYIDH